LDPIPSTLFKKAILEELESIVQEARDQGVEEETVLSWSQDMEDTFDLTDNDGKLYWEDLDWLLERLKEIDTSKVSFFFNSYRNFRLLPSLASTDSAFTSINLPGSTEEMAIDYRSSPLENRSSTRIERDGDFPRSDGLSMGI